jgi:hypothetical protein
MASATRLDVQVERVIRIVEHCADRKRVSGVLQDGDHEGVLMKKIGVIIE